MNKIISCDELNELIDVKKQVIVRIVSRASYLELLSQALTERIVKETSVGAYIGIVELTKASDIIASRTYDYFFPLILIAIIYLIITYGLSTLVGLMEKRLNNARN